MPRSLYIIFTRANGASPPLCRLLESDDDHLFGNPDEKFIWVRGTEVRRSVRDLTGKGPPDLLLIADSYSFTPGDGPYASLLSGWITGSTGVSVIFHNGPSDPPSETVCLQREELRQLCQTAERPLREAMEHHISGFPGADALEKIALALEADPFDDEGYKKALQELQDHPWYLLEADEGRLQRLKAERASGPAAPAPGAPGKKAAATSARKTEKADKEEHLFILDKVTAALAKGIPGSRTIVSEREWEELKVRQELKDPNNWRSVVILCELDWSGRYLQSCYGLAVAAELRRRHKLRCPILLLSNLERSWFEHMIAVSRRTDHHIFYGPGTAFVPLHEWRGDPESVLAKIPPLSEAALADMNEMLLQKKGFVTDRLNHDIRDGMTGEQLDRLAAFVEGYLDTNQLQAIGWNENFAALAGDIRSGKDISLAKDSLLLHIGKGLDNDPGAMATVRADPYRLLVLEDDPVFRQEIEHRLAPYFKITATGEAGEALRILQEDNANEIVGFLSDWRLYREGRLYWQQQQGYDVLSWAASHRHIALFALTSLEGQNVHTIRNLLRLDIQLFRKQYLYTSGRAQWEVLADTLLKKCGEMHELIVGEIATQQWKKNYRPQYLEKRKHGWDAFEDKIAAKATELYRYYHDNAFSAERGRNVNGLQEVGMALKDNLENTLIVRRVYLGLYFALVKKNNPLQHISRSILNAASGTDTEMKAHSIDTYSLLRKEWWEDIENELPSTEWEDAWGKFDQRMKNLRLALCIEHSEMPRRGILPEEKTWLTRHQVDHSLLFPLWDDDDPEN